jgi:hypothetical protein
MRDPISAYAPVITQGYARAHTRYLFLVGRASPGQPVAARHEPAERPAVCAFCRAGTGARLASLLRWGAAPRSECRTCRFLDHYSQ